MTSANTGGNFRLVAGLLCAVWMGGGCGRTSDGPVRYEVSGSVTFDGKPVPGGYITFAPDTSQGNSGPGGGAAITQGRYRTEAGKGIVGGPHSVRIVGYDGQPTTVEGEFLADGSPLFVPFETTVDFPRQPAVQDFKVPTPTESASDR